MGIRERAVARFAALRAEALDDLARARLSPGPHPPPDGWCISTVARVVNDASTLIEPLQQLQDRLDRTGAWQHYAAASMHVSLLGCTRREPDDQQHQHERLASIDAAVAQQAAEFVPVAVTLGRLGLLGPQAFVEVVPSGDAWAQMRRQLAAALTAIGESPMTHPDPEPMHLNVSRLAGGYDGAALSALLRGEQASIDASVELSTIELVVTDFALTPGRTTIVATYGRPQTA